MPLFPLAAALAHGNLIAEVCIIIAVNVGGTIACVAGARWALRDVEGVHPSLVAWPWEAAAWGIPTQQQPTTKAEESAAAPPAVEELPPAEATKED